MFFSSEIYCLDTFCSFLFNILNLVFRNVLLLFRLIVTLISISADNTIQLRYLLSIKVLYNLLMILSSINQPSECKVFNLSYLYGNISRTFSTFFFVFPCRYHNVWYTRVGIFNSLAKCTSANVRCCYNVHFFLNLFNKIKFHLKLFLSFLIFCFDLRVLILFI